ncbi:hypothetical protein EGH21_16830 [Halomicroarcula sp. F13]|uniref:YjeF N-terminal domain-containing protein n=1 Tax=Haloarcula rubra TaxID=2487747 RepID=A0AAW4PUJ4_9EURY|nr:hypothetical protein [Halomicroarcula rubra]MBX0324693.1 hypothetical protein [Halomicroarcula rubra]
MEPNAFRTPDGDSVTALTAAEMRAVDPDRVVTLALPKTGLVGLDADLVLADIGLPSGVYARLDLPEASPFGDEYAVALSPST